MVSRRKETRIVFPRWGRVRRRPLMTEAEWIEAGRPHWLLRAYEQYSTHRTGWSFYRTYVPCHKPLDAVFFFSPWTSRAEAGVYLKGEERFRETVPSEVRFVPPDEADHDKNRYASNTFRPGPDRSLHPGNAQTYEPKEA